MAKKVIIAWILGLALIAGFATMSLVDSNHAHGAGLGVSSGGGVAVCSGGFGTGSTNCARGNDTRLQRGSGALGLTTGGQSISSQITVPFDTKGYADRGAVASCDISSTKGVCTVLVAGVFNISCGISVTATFSAGNAVTLRVQQNGADLATGGVANIVFEAAQVAPTPTVEVNGQAVFAVNDTFSCAALSGGSSPTLNSSKAANYLNYSFQGP